MSLTAMVFPIRLDSEDQMRLSRKPPRIPEIESLPEYRSSVVSIPSFEFALDCQQATGVFDTVHNAWLFSMCPASGFVASRS